MAMICVLAGLGLVAFAAAIAFATGRNRRGGAARAAPPLPSRASTSAPAPSPARRQTRTGGRPAIRPLPPRRPPKPAAASMIQFPAAASRGPRGITLYQFPCCPFCKRRNLRGYRQEVYWNGEENCYRCSRGHRFLINGRPF